MFENNAGMCNLYFGNGKIILFANLYWRRNNCNLFQIANSNTNKPVFLAHQINPLQTGKSQAPYFIFPPDSFMNSAI
jgi:hypothetical protein